MAERAAHLDHVFPAVPVRQWVLSLAHRLRYILAWDHGLCRAVRSMWTSLERCDGRLDVGVEPFWLDNPRR